ncbi:MAG TPA: LysR family transcriptional regulator [Patescibacteria group bacterium]|nr:LysR family transcriptional regulator [Patescibacteria group bacterium]
MDIHHLRYFTEVARRKSFSKAAAALHVSQSAISKMVKDLETELGAALFNRTSKQVEMTDAGVKFLSQASQVVSLFDGLATDFDRQYRIAKGKIIIGLPPLTESTQFAQILGKYRSNFPDVHIELYEFGSKKVESAVQEGTLDIGIMCRVPNPELYESFTFISDPLRLIVSVRHPLARVCQVKLADLADESFVLYTDDFSLHDEIIQRCRVAGFQPKVVFETSRKGLMVQTVAANFGVAFLPGTLCEDLNPEFVTAIPLVHPEILHTMSVIWKKGRHLSYPAKLWLDFAEQYLLAGRDG